MKSLNCNHHLQLLPPRCSSWTSTERGRERTEIGGLLREQENTHEVEVLVFVLFIISQKFHASQQNRPLSYSNINPLLGRLILGGEGS